MSEICYNDNNNNNKMINSGKRWAPFKIHLFREYRSKFKDKIYNLEQHIFYRKNNKIEKLSLKIILQCLPFNAVAGKTWSLFPAILQFGNKINLGVSEQRMIRSERRRKAKQRCYPLRLQLQQLKNVTVLFSSVFCLFSVTS